MLSYPQSLALDFLHLAFMLTVVGLPVYAMVSKKFPLLQWERRGNVWSAPFGIFDLLVVALLFAGARAMIISHQPVDIEKVTAASIFASALLFLSLAALLCSLLIMRGNHLVEVFGLDRLSPWAITWRSLVGIVISGGLVYGVTLILQKFVLHTTWTENSQQSLVRLLSESSDTGLRVTVAVSACLIAPIAEEIVFRGFLYPALKRYSDQFFAALVSSMIFAAIHIHAPALLPLCLLGILLVASYEWSGSLWLPISIHALFNTLTVVSQSIGGGG